MTRRRFLAAAGAVAVSGLALAVVLDKLEAADGAPPTFPDPAAAGDSVQPAGSGASGRAAQTLAGVRRHFESRPDLTLSMVSVETPNGGPSPGLVFFTPDNGAPPDGLLIVDNAGHPVWVRPDTNRSSPPGRSTGRATCSACPIPSRPRPEPGWS